LNLSCIDFMEFPRDCWVLSLWRLPRVHLESITQIWFSCMWGVFYFCESEACRSGDEYGKPFVSGRGGTRSELLSHATVIVGTTRPGIRRASQSARARWSWHADKSKSV
jgi:hypothetical protein